MATQKSNTSLIILASFFAFMFGANLFSSDAPMHQQHALTDCTSSKNATLIKHEWLESPFERGAAVITKEHVTRSFWEKLPGVKINLQDPNICSIGNNFYLCSGLLYHESLSGELRTLRIPTLEGVQGPILNLKSSKIRLKGQLHPILSFVCITSNAPEFGTGSIILHVNETTETEGVPWVSPDKHNEAGIVLMYPAKEHQSKLVKVIEDNFPEFHLAQ